MVRPLVVGDVVGLDRDPLARDQRRHRLGAGAVGAVAEPDRHRRVVEPEAVAAVGVRALGQLADDRHAEALELLARVAGLPLARRLAHPQRDPAARR